MESESEAKFEALGSTLLDFAPEGAEAYVYAYFNENLPPRELWRSGKSEVGTGGDAKRVLGVCRHGKIAVVIDDAEKDDHMKGIKVRSFASAMAVPVFDSDETLAGMLLLASSDLSAFGKEHQDKMERAAQDFAEPIVAVRQIPGPLDSSDSDEPGSSSSPLVAVSLLLAMVVLGLWMLGPSDPPASAKQAVKVSTEVKGRAEMFLDKLRKEKPRDAWFILNDDLKSRWPKDDFVIQATRWSNRENNLEILNERRISQVQKKADRFQVVLFQSSHAGDSGPWHWEFKKEKNRWHISSMSGPLQSPSPKSER